MLDNNWKEECLTLRASNVVVVPNAHNLRNRIIDWIHGRTHPGAEETLRRIKKIAWWEKIKSDVSDRVRSCTSCQKYKAVQNPMRPIIITETETNHFARVQIDLTGPYEISGIRKRMNFFLIKKI